MAEATELGTSQIVTRDGIVTATVLDKVSADRMMLYLAKGSVAALYGRTEDKTELISRQVKDLIIFPFTEL